MELPDTVSSSKTTPEIVFEILLCDSFSQALRYEIVVVFLCCYTPMGQMKSNW